MATFQLFFQSGRAKDLSAPVYSAARCDHRENSDYCVHIYSNRPTEGEFHKYFPILKDSYQFYGYSSMNPDTFIYVLGGGVFSEAKKLSNFRSCVSSVEKLVVTLVSLCSWFLASQVYINKCPTRCNNMQSVFYFTARSLYMFRVPSAPIIRST